MADHAAAEVSQPESTVAEEGMQATAAESMVTDMAEESTQVESTIPAAGESRQAVSGAVNNQEISESTRVKLYLAAMKGDWYGAQKLVRSKNMISSIWVNQRKDTALHFAALSKRERFVKHLIRNLNNASDIETTNESGRDALYFAAASGAVEIAKAVVEGAQEHGVSLSTNSWTNALCVAADFKHHQMVNYLFSQGPHDDLYRNLMQQQHEQIAVPLLISCIDIGLYDIVVRLLGKKRTLATIEHNNDTILKVLARTPSAFAGETRLSERFINFCRKVMRRNWKQNSDHDHRYVSDQLLETCSQALNQITNEEHQKLVVEAAKAGNTEFLNMLIKFDPELIWTATEYDWKSGGILHIAVEYRHNKIFILVFEFGAIKDILAMRLDNETDQNTLLHLAAKRPPSEKLNAIFGPAFQMHRELKWFKEVEKMVPAIFKELPNSRGQTPKALFDESHKDLREEGEKWMKKTAESFMLVATLIATMMFTAALSVPGGFDNNTGQPILKGHMYFKVFAISDAVALLCSSVSLLLFLSSYHSSHNTEPDFGKCLPELMLGSALLCISMAAMMIAFAAIFVLYFHLKFAFLIFLLAAIPLLFSRWFINVIFHSGDSISSLPQTSKRSFEMSSNII